MTDHPTLPELAEWDADLLDAERSTALAGHVAECAECAESMTELREVSRRLAAVPAPPMPAAVTTRLDAVLAGEVERRGQRPTLVATPDQTGGGVPWSKGGWSRPTLGHFGQDLPRRSARRVVLPLLAAAALASVVGFGAYVVSASVGLNEPPVVAAVSSRSLGPQAGAVERSTDLDPHRFSRAWQCARQVTDGRIVGLAGSTVDGTPALLVYTRSGGTTLVTVVTGCDSGRPSAGPSAAVTRR